MTDSYQQTSAPYSLDVVPAHDKQARGWNLAWLREFGTNVNAELGDNYNATVGNSPDVAARINARLGMLECEYYEAEAPEPLWRGRTFALPSWASVPVNNGDGLQYRCLFAHLLTDQGELSPAQVALLLGNSFLVGSGGGADGAAFVNVALQMSLPGIPSPYVQVDPPTAFTAVYGSGGAFPVTAEGDTVLSLGSSVYVRVLMYTDGKDSQAQVWLSANGVGWFPLATSLFFAGFLFERVGLGVAGGPLNGDSVVGRLDWLRLYDQTDPDADFNSEGPLELAAQSGARLFVP